MFFQSENFKNEFVYGSVPLMQYTIVIYDFLHKQYTSGIARK